MIETTPEGYRHWDMGTVTTKLLSAYNRGEEVVLDAVEMIVLDSLTNPRVNSRIDVDPSTRLLEVSVDASIPNPFRPDSNQRPTQYFRESLAS